MGNHYTLADDGTRLNGKYLYSLDGRGAYTEEELLKVLDVSQSTLWSHIEDNTSFFGRKVQKIAVKGWKAQHKHKNDVIKEETAEELARDMMIDRKTLAKIAREELPSNWVISRCWIYWTAPVPTYEEEIASLKEQLADEHDKCFRIHSWAARELSDLDGHLTELGYYDYEFLALDGHMMVDPKYEVAHPIDSTEWYDIIDESVRMAIIRKKQREGKI